MSTSSARPGAKPGFPQPRWQLHELLVLIQAKLRKSESVAANKGKDQMKTADMRWAEVAAWCKGEGVTRAASHCRSKWEKLLTDFQKVYDWQRNVPSGQLGYFEMTQSSTKELALPTQFAHEWYQAMETWVPKHRAVNPDPQQVIDSSTMPKHVIDPFTMPEHDVSSEGSAPLQGSTPEYVTDEPGLGVEVLGNDMEDTFMSTDDQTQTPVTPQEEPHTPQPSSNDIPGAAPLVRGHRKRKVMGNSRAESTFIDISGKFMDAMSMDSDKRHGQELAYFQLEERRHALEERKHDVAILQHQQLLDQQERIVGQISSALNNNGPQSKSSSRSSPWRKMLPSKDDNFVGYIYKNFEIVQDSHVPGVAERMKKGKPKRPSMKSLFDPTSIGGNGSTQGSFMMLPTQPKLLRVLFLPLLVACPHHVE